jgi:4-alpha-glucanotransferase
LTEPHSVIDRRRAGVLLHITSLPGSGNTGDLGPEAYRFIDTMSACGLSVWQTLPINPTHSDGSPYQCLSVHAGEPGMISLDWLAARGWLSKQPKQKGPPGGSKQTSLRQAFSAFKKDIYSPYQHAYEKFVKRQAWWLDDYALFMALRQKYRLKPWQQWPPALRDRHRSALMLARLRVGSQIAQIQFEQFVFFQQWRELRDYAQQRGIRLFGDMPIFVACDSADVWSRRNYFDLDERGRCHVVAGVPPDYFSATGQRWGNPHYNWERLKADGFSWWIERLNTQLELYDWIRIDHFRGFEAYWEIPSESETAIDGRWVKAPGKDLLETLFKKFGSLPLVAENLGIITPEVEALRNEFSIPGMLVLQFAFDGGPDNPYLPQNHTENNVVYTGTHDNNTTLGWFESLSPQQQAHVYACLGNPARSMPQALIDSALASVARLAIIPMQDILWLGKEHRMNTPGTTDNNWRWRFAWEWVTQEKLDDLAQQIQLHGRSP